MKPLSKLAMVNLSGRIALRLTLLLTVGLTGLPSSHAQAAPSHRTAHHAKPSASKAAELSSTPAQPQSLPTPNWPANNPPAPPTVTWDAQGLRIQAANASLRQVLNEVASTTGAKLEGLNSDERIFGIYGPGPAKDVLSQLLHGTAYNVLMLGDLGQGAPREIVLSARGANIPAGSNRASQPNPGDEDDQSDAQDEPVQPQTIQPQIMRTPEGGPPLPGPLHSPQDRLREMQRQQQEMQRQQQQQLQQMQQNQQQQ